MNIEELQFKYDIDGQYPPSNTDITNKINEIIRVIQAIHDNKEEV